MRIIHTSDWHLGQHFMGKSRAAEHKAFLDWLLEQVAEHRVDAVIVAGDVFDTGAPPSYARELYNQFIVQMQAQGARLVILGGNHDSVATLGESRELLACLNTQVIPGGLSGPEQHLIELEDRQGQPGALLCAIPFLRARDLLASEAGQSGQDKQAALTQAIADRYRAVFELAQARNKASQNKLPILATGHLTTVGARSSESVRDIYIGTLDAFPASAFPEADYIALGHLHKAQKVAGSEHIRYCGSPIPLSFDEAGQQKQVLLVAFDQGALQSVSALAVPLFQPLASLKGELEALGEQIRALPPGSWLEVEVTGQDYLSDLQARVQALCEGIEVELLRVRRSRSGERQLAAEAKETLADLNPTEVFERRLAAEQLEPALAGELRSRFSTVLSELENDA
ncbi:exonuclease subunit SbcD [Gallaecimonas sp. GXIMD4217]|uniref:exonuclease subunit SbcD n=1 Tax=Gallaecimonas sp. GXIMD4217 TaxID=3131927 RepID=UPI00311B025D